MKRSRVLFPAAAGLAILITAISTVSIRSARAGTPLSSVPVRDVESGARDPINITGEFVIPDGAIGITVGFPGPVGKLPAGKRFVIETVTAHADLPPNQRPILQVVTFDGEHFIPFTQQRLFDRVHMEASRRVKLYSASDVKVDFAREGELTGEARCTVTLSGYYVTI